MNDIGFPNLGIWLHNVTSGFSIGNFTIKFYGLIIAVGFVLAYLLIEKEAKRTGQDPDVYLDYILWMIIPAIIGARIYYIIFSSKEFFGGGRSVKDTIVGLINIRNGGLAIYGGIIVGVIFFIVYAKKKDIPAPKFADTIIMGLLVGQILGRWGNFFNREAFGGFTKSILAMAIPVSYYENTGSLQYLINKGIINQSIIDNVQVYDGIEYIQVHPTFLYESLWNLALLIIIFMYRKNKRFEGELFLMYLWGYGLGRVWIEGLRADSLMIGPMKVSQLLAAICVIFASVLMAKKRLQLKRSQN